ncbi:hypothetical protein NS183_10630, partial [Microbacterium testaceum]|uniref:DUF2510 domain-containing protein n=1 Tax=Microbacterium testaceum TaxID=2033 RepID=UPI000799F758
MTDTPTPPEGWYPDPAGSGGTRRWDGTAWTDEVRPAVTEHADAAQADAPSPAGAEATEVVAAGESRDETEAAAPATP